MRLSERGSVLAEVLIAMLFMAIVSAAVMRARLQPVMNAAASVARVNEELAARTALNRVAESWTVLESCAMDAAADISCAGFGCNCRCLVGSVVVTVVPQGGACALSVAAP